MSGIIRALNVVIVMPNSQALDALATPHAMHSLAGDGAAANGHAVTPRGFNMDESLSCPLPIFLLLFWKRLGVWGLMAQEDLWDPGIGPAKAQGYLINSSPLLAVYPQFSRRRFCAPNSAPSRGRRYRHRN